ncbi:MAG: family 2 glycosyl transferase [Elusimicrobia bacterium]|nr:MAG: family 2 glycosyl transferase [Elusimicrobiota bacterium]
MRISVSIIGHNEAHNLPRCLASVKWADEVVYVDCASADGSAELAASLGARVFTRPNDANLNVNKQFGLEQCSGDWIFYLDPDEEVSAGLAEGLRGELEKSRYSAYVLPRRNYYFGRWLKRGGKYPDRQLRIFRRGKASFPCVDVHERLKVDGPVGALRWHIDHHPYNTAAELLRKLDFYTGRGAGRCAEKGKPVSLTRAGRKFLVNYFVLRGFMDGPEGFVSASFDLFNECLTWLKHREGGGAGGR